MKKKNVERINTIKAKKKNLVIKAPGFFQAGLFTWMSSFALDRLIDQKFSVFLSSVFGGFFA